MGLNVNSRTIYNENYLELSGDKCVKTRSAVKDKGDLVKNCAVLAVEHMSWIGKHFSVIRENKKSYFESTKSTELRRVDFMDY